MGSIVAELNIEMTSEQIAQMVIDADTDQSGEVPSPFRGAGALTQCLGRRHCMRSHR